MKSILATSFAFLPLFHASVYGRAQGTTASSTACNNSPSLCSLPYFNVTYLGAHDSAFVSNSSNGYDISGNQFYNTTMQLNAGVRLLQSQIQYRNSSDPASGLHLCHTSCNLYDAGPIENWLSEVRTWMDANPNEVVTILLVNGVDADAAALEQIFTSSGITQYAYTPQSTTPSTWPTLQEMISANTRLVTFIANIATGSSTYLLNEFDYIWENNYDVSSPTNFTCVPDRPSSLAGSIETATSSGRMFFMNHFLYQEQLFNIQSPDVDATPQINSPDTSVQGSLGSHAQTCVSQVGAKPNYVLVDYFSVGPAIETVDSLNGVTDATGRTQVSSENLKAVNEAQAGAARQIGVGAASLFLTFATSVWIVLC